MESIRYLVTVTSVNESLGEETVTEEQTVEEVSSCLLSESVECDWTEIGSAAAAYVVLAGALLFGLNHCVRLYHERLAGAEAEDDESEEEDDESEEEDDVSEEEDDESEEEEDESEEEDDVIVICPICEDRAHHLHYGILTCKACAMFFMRTVQLKLVYTCVADGECIVKEQQRTRCRYCRYQECLRRGMVLAAVLEGRSRGRHSGAVNNL